MRRRGCRSRGPELGRADDEHRRGGQRAVRRLRRLAQGVDALHVGDQSRPPAPQHLWVHCHVPERLHGPPARGRGPARVHGDDHVWHLHAADRRRQVRECAADSEHGVFRRRRGRGLGLHRAAGRVRAPVRCHVGLHRLRLHDGAGARPPGLRRLDWHRDVARHHRDALLRPVQRRPRGGGSRRRCCALRVLPRRGAAAGAADAAGAALSTAAAPADLVHDLPRRLPHVHRCGGRCQHELRMQSEQQRRDHLL